jgi:transposase
MKPNGDSKPRRQFPAETKLQILKEGRTTNLTISQVCDQYQISPTLFYQWERIADRATLTALQGQPRGRKKLRPSEEALLVEVQRLREVIAELSSENLQLKKGRWR